MFAIIAAVLFAVVLILDLAGKSGLGSVLTAGFLTTAGFLCIALHLAGVGNRVRAYRRRT
jgi:hypothetical protein